MASLPTKPKDYEFTAHALERGLERIMGIYSKPTQKQYDDIRNFILASIEWNPFTEKWVLVDFGVELTLLEDGTVVTTAPITEPIKVNHKPLTQYQKTHTKRKRK